MSYQWRAALLGVQADLEILPDLFGKDGVAPAAYVVVVAAAYMASDLGLVLAFAILVIAARRAGGRRDGVDRDGGDVAA